MATYAIGDVQGCFVTLARLLARCGFVAGGDRLFLVGDLVNRGPRSLEVLRWAAACPLATAVLGNHDLHLLARAEGLAAAKPGDTLDAVLAAPDRKPLLRWLRRLPFARLEAGTLLVHAGLLPSWTVSDAAAFADAASRLLVSDGVGPLLSRTSAAAQAALVLTRLRACDPAGRPLWSHKAGPPDLPAGVIPWFDVPGRRSVDTTVVFGHWARLGFLARERLLGIDTGCVWGGCLTAVRLDDRAVWHEPVAEGEQATPARPASKMGRGGDA